MVGSSWVVERLTASQEGLMDLPRRFRLVIIMLLGCDRRNTCNLWMMRAEEVGNNVGESSRPVHTPNAIPTWNKAHFWATLREHGESLSVWALKWIEPLSVFHQTSTSDMPDAFPHMWISPLLAVSHETQTEFPSMYISTGRPGWKNPAHYKQWRKYDRNRAGGNEEAAITRLAASGEPVLPSSGLCPFLLCRFFTAR
jgi:hypothetical protein